jgi:hypothetical protein
MALFSASFLSAWRRHWSAFYPLRIGRSFIYGQVRENDWKMKRKREKRREN